MYWWVHVKISSLSTKNAKNIIPKQFCWPSVPPSVLILGSPPQFLAPILMRQLLSTQILPINKLQSLNKGKVTTIQTTCKMNTSWYKHIMRTFEFYVINQWSLTFLKQIFIKQKKVSRSTLVPSCLHHGIILNKIPQLLMSTKLEIFRIPQLLMSTKLEKKRNRES